ncbi:hypothetical protein ACIAD1275 [Acinetobacter baylyi ADP1]|uniref:Uncharacterized protein n=1 Tax=Acinetobacter baylyi (strain ATCC 33305 / BD413 / ADP1) TaxID=62977 RepID=Q6FCR0_ACIAD|nr:hypothetical protein ACIAD1275 [Acinetobacter baylyi ADP1]
MQFYLICTETKHFKMLIDMHLFVMIDNQPSSFLITNISKLWVEISF